MLHRMWITRFLSTNYLQGERERERESKRDLIYKILTNCIVRFLFGFQKIKLKIKNFSESIGNIDRLNKLLSLLRYNYEIVVRIKRILTGFRDTD